MRIIRNFLVLFICLLATAHAETNQLYLPVDSTFPDQNDDVGQIVLIDSSYDTITKRLRWYVTYQEVAGNPLPQGFSLVLNGTGRNPLKTLDGLAFFYFDAQDPLNLRLVVYGYNFADKEKNSWKCGTTDPACPPADKIISSVSDPSFIQDLTFEDISPSMRRMGFTIDASEIQSHTPLYLSPPAVWQGAQFPFPSTASPKYVGIWYHGYTVDPTSPITYGADGFFTNWARDEEGYFDTKDTLLDGTIDPLICNAGVGYSGLSCAAATTSTQLDGSGSHDVKGRPLTYAWSSDCPNATFNDSSAVNPIVTLSSIGSSGIPASCFVTLVVADGVSQANCKAPVSVSNCINDCNGAPNGTAVFDDCGMCSGNNSDKDRCGVCFGDGNSCLGCKSVNTSLELLALDQGSRSLLDITKTVAAKSRRLRGSRTVREEKLLAQSNQEYLNAWHSVYQVPQEFLQCENSQFCVSVSHLTPLTNFVVASANQETIALEMLHIYRKVLQRSGVDRPTAFRRVRELRKKVRQLHQDNLTMASAVPSYSSVC